MADVYLPLNGPNDKGKNPKGCSVTGWNEPSYRGVTGWTDDAWTGLRLDDYIVVDCDSDEAASAWVHHSGHLEHPTWERKTPHGWHYIYRKVPAKPFVSGAQLKSIHPKIDLKSGPGHQIVFRAPGYFDVHATDPIPFDYSWLPPVMEHDKGIPEWDDLPEGMGDNFLTSIGGKLREWGASEKVIEQCLQHVNTITMRDPMPMHRVRRIARSVSKYETGETHSVSCPKCDTSFEVM